MVKSSTEVEVFSLTMFAESGPVDFACEIERSGVTELHRRVTGARRKKDVSEGRFR